MNIDEKTYLCFFITLSNFYAHKNGIIIDMVFLILILICFYMFLKKGRKK